eukprot:scaffold60894_cov45-Phaeocystis_antarctica.AAC.1
MESDQEPEEEGRGAGTCSSSSAPMRPTERLRWVDGSALRLPGVLRWGDEALGRETLQLVGSDRDSEGLSLLRWPLAIAHESDRQYDLLRREVAGFPIPTDQLASEPNRRSCVIAISPPSRPNRRKMRGSAREEIAVRAASQAQLSLPFGGA